jgi:hypothetical protein
MKQPFGIRMLTWFAALASMGMFLSILLAILDVGPHLMGGERVTRSETALIAHGLGAGRLWSRHLVMMIFILIIAYASALGAVNMLRQTIMWRAIVNASVFGCVAAWYFYVKPNVGTYFRELARR